jgi:hypothetical protein
MFVDSDASKMERGKKLVLHAEDTIRPVITTISNKEISGMLNS